MEDRRTLVVNLFGGPGSGKSTLMAGLFAELKLRGVNCEQAPEFAKEKVWEGSLSILENQIYVFGKQLHTIHRVNKKVDVVITDSPLILSIMYGAKEGEEFKNLVLKVFGRFWNYNVFVKRHKEYNPSGRLQTEEKAKELDDVLKDILAKNGIDYTQINGDREAPRILADCVIGMIGEDRMKYIERKIE